jgi:hypothetical protein
MTDLTNIKIVKDQNGFFLESEEGNILGRAKTKNEAETLRNDSIRKIIPRTKETTNHVHKNRGRSARKMGSAYGGARGEPIQDCACVRSPKNIPFASVAKRTGASGR